MIRKTIIAAFLIAGLLLVVAIVLSNVGGQSPVLKKTLEDFVTQSTGYQAQIHNLHNVRIFPYVTIELENLELNAPAQGEITHWGVDRFFMKVSVWDVLMGSGAFTGLDVQGLRLPEQALTPKRLEIESLNIREGANQEAALVLKGRYGENDVVIETAVNVKGHGRLPHYSFADKRPLSLSYGDVDMQTTFVHVREGVLFDGLQAKKAGKDVLQANLLLAPQEESVEQIKQWHISGKTLLAQDQKWYPVAGDLMAYNGEVVLKNAQENDPQVNCAFAALGLPFSKTVGFDQEKCEVK